jgi:hypothetical protein
MQARRLDEIIPQFRSLKIGRNTYPNKSASRIRAVDGISLHIVLIKAPDERERRLW